jgi:peptidoglycan/xylan/chitin deacetylase (PgdA/CDA1 family)
MNTHTGEPPAARQSGYVALTFDDGPTENTPDLLRALRAACARATLFNVGAHAAHHPDLVHAQRRAGMWIGNHSYTHPHLTGLGEPAAFEEIARAQRVLRQINGRAPLLFRPPYGETDAGVSAAAARLGLREVLWTVDTRDWAGASTAEIVAAAETVQPGGIVLMHDGYRTTVEAVPRIVRALAERGLRPGRIGFRGDDQPVATAPWQLPPSPLAQPVRPAPETPETPETEAPELSP